MKPCEFPIHGAVDGFSRTVLWLAVGKLSNNPVVPATLYLRAFKEHAQSVITCSKLTVETLEHGVKHVHTIETPGHHWFLGFLTV